MFEMLNVNISSLNSTFFFNLELSYYLGRYFIRHFILSAGGWIGGFINLGSWGGSFTKKINKNKTQNVEVPE